MTATVALPADLKETANTVVTFVVPARNGCNLRCPFCFISQRKEHTAEALLTPTEYGRFIDEVAVRTPIDAICIQGYEPLLPEAFEYTSAILQAARKHDVASSLITNGTYLAERIGDLETLGLYTIFVSIDAASAAAHDKQRGVAGAFDAAVSGLRRAAESSVLNGRITVTSVLISKKRDQLLGLPRLLREHEVSRWIVNPLIQIGEDKIGQFKADKSQIFQDALVLKREADAHGIKFLIDDEFDRLSHEIDHSESVDINAHRFLSVQRLRRPGGVYRLMPNGQCSVGLEILKEVSSTTPCWLPNEMDAFNFIQSLEGCTAKRSVPSPGVQD